MPGKFKSDNWPIIVGNEFLINLGAALVYQITDAPPLYGADEAAKWGECLKHSLADVLPWVDYWRAKGKKAYPAHFGTGSILWIDFDDRPSRAEADYGKGQTLETAQAAYDVLLAACCEETYVEKSRTEGRYHAAFRLPDGHGLPLRQIKGLHGIDLLIGNGWIRLTGESNGKPTAEIPADLLAELQSISSEYHFDGVPHSSVEGDANLCALPLEEAVTETRRRMCISSNRTQQGFTYQQLIEGPAALSEDNLSESRAALIQWAAKITCGHKDQHEIVWRIVSESHLAEVTPSISKQNKRRFTSPAKINYDRFNARGEHHKLIGIANREVEEAKAEADAQREKTAALMLQRKGKRLVDQAYWTYADIGDFPVKLARDYRDYLLTSVAKTNTWIANGATLAHLGHFLGNRVCGTTGVFPAIYIVIPAPAGGGKDAASYETALRVARDFIYAIGNLGSGGGLHKALLEPDCRGCGLVVIDEYQDFLRGVGNEHLKGSQTTLKTVYGKMQVGRELPKMTLVGQPRSAVYEPALNVIGMGIEDEILAAFAETSLSDGFFARHLFIDTLSECKRVRNRRVEYTPPAALMEGIAGVLHGLPVPASLPSVGDKQAPEGSFGRAIPATIYFESEELEDEAYTWSVEVDDLREERYAGTRFGEMLRAAAENAYRLATILGAYAPHQQITGAIWEWSRGYAINSVAYLLAKDAEGALDSNTTALAGQIMVQVQQFFDGSGSKHESQQRMREAGQFRLGSLPNWKRIEDKAANIDKADPTRPIMAAIRLLKMNNRIEVVQENRDFAKQVYGKGSIFDET